MSSDAQPSTESPTLLVHGRERLNNSTLSLVEAMMFLCAGIGFLQPPLAIYFTWLGLTASNIALLGIVPPMALIFFGQVWGWLADAHISRPVLLTTASLSAAILAALYPALPAELWMLAAGLFIYSVFSQFRMSLLVSIILESHRGEERFGPVRLLGSAAFVVTTFLIGYLIDLPWAGPAIMWLALASTDGLLAFSSARLTDHPKISPGPGQTARPGFWDAQRRLLGDPLLLRFCLFTLVLQAAHFPGLLLAPRLAADVGGSSLLATAILALSAIAEIPIFLFARRILDRIGPMTMLGIGGAAIVLRWAIIGFWPHLGGLLDLSKATIDLVHQKLLLATALLHAFSFGTSYLAGIFIMRNEAPPDLQSSAQSLFTLVFGGFSIVIGNLFAWQVLRWASLSDYYLLSSLFALLGMTLYLPMWREWQRRSHSRKKLPNPAALTALPEGMQP